MTMMEQEKLFKRIRKKFKKRSATWCSGYLHGLQDEGRRKKPDAAYLGRAQHDYSRSYGTGYLWGFLDARGEDALEWRWARRLTPTGKALQFQWWHK